MSSLFTAKEICERALRLIGAFPIVDSQADAEELAEALTWLDLIMAELSGTELVFWLVPDTLTVPLSGGVGTYNLLNALGASAPRNGIEFPVECWIADASGNRSDITMLTRRGFEVLGAATGTPTHVHIDRLGDPTLRTYPVLGSDVANGTYSLKIVAQTYTEDFAGGNGVKQTGARAAWQKWLVYQLAADIGSGPVRRVGVREVHDLKAVAEESRGRLFGFENQQHTGLPNTVTFRDF